MTTVTAPPLAMTDEQRAALEAMARSTTLAHRKVLQAKALLLAADGVGTNEVASAVPHHQRLGARLASTVRGPRASTACGRIAKGRGSDASWAARGNGRRRCPRHLARSSR